MLVAVYSDADELAADAAITTLGFDTELPNNTDEVAVQSVPAVVRAVPGAELAFTGFREGTGFFITRRRALRRRRAVLMLLASGRRRDDEAYADA